MDRQAAKAIQDAAIGRFSLSSSEGSEESANTTKKHKRAKTDSGEKRSRGSLKASFESMCESIADRKSIAVQELSLKKELLREQMLLKKAQVDAQLKMKAEKHELELQEKKQQLQMNAKMMAMMEQMMKQNENK
jgi:hypothetical protein